MEPETLFESSVTRLLNSSHTPHILVL